MDIDQVRQDAAFELDLLRKVYENGLKDQPMWYKSLIFLTVKLSRASLFPEIEKILALFPADGSYFRDSMPGEMQSDPLFSDAVIELVQFLVKNRIVDMTYEADIPLTQFVVGQA